MPPHEGLYYEDFAAGQRFETDSHVVTAAEIGAFAELTGDDNPLHLDPRLARAAGFKDVIAHGLLVQSLTVGLVARLGVMRGTTIALLSTQARFIAPVLAGDEIHGAMRVTSKRAASGSRGILWRVVDVLNQDGVVVMEMKSVNLMRKRGES